MRFSFEFRVSPQVPKAGLVIDAGWVGETVGARYCKSVCGVWGNLNNLTDSRTATEK